MESVSATDEIIFDPEMKKEEDAKKKRDNGNDDKAEKNGNLSDKDHEGQQELLESVEISSVVESKDPEVKIQSISISCPGRPDLNLAVPLAPNSNKSSSLFSLKEGSPYRLKFTFVVSNKIVSGLQYANAAWKNGVKVDNSKVKLGTFSPQQEPYTYELDEDVTPSGIFGRGLYSARTKLLDDDGKCYLDIRYCFEIQKKWPS